MKKLIAIISIFTLMFTFAAQPFCFAGENSYSNSSNYKFYDSVNTPVYPDRFSSFITDGNKMALEYRHEEAATQYNLLSSDENSRTFGKKEEFITGVLTPDDECLASMIAKKVSGGNVSFSSIKEKFISKLEQYHIYNSIYSMAYICVVPSVVWHIIKKMYPYL